MPIGPREISASWFARCRLAVSTISYRFWDTEGTKWLTLLSRCMDKRQKYTVACLAEAFRRLLKPNHTKVECWCDCAPNFRAREFVGSTLVKSLKKEGITSARIHFKADHHGKCEIDGYLGALSRFRKEVSKERSIEDVPDLVSAYEEKAALRKEIDPAWDETFVDWIVQGVLMFF